MRKAQVSVELALCVAIVILIFISVTIVTSFIKKDIGKTEKMLDERKDCLLLSNTINSIDANRNDGSIKVNIRHNASVRGPSRMIYFNDYLCRFNTWNITNGATNIFNIQKGCVKIDYKDEVTTLSGCEEAAPTPTPTPTPTPSPPACPGTVVFRTNATNFTVGQYRDYGPAYTWIAINNDNAGNLDGYIRTSTPPQPFPIICTTFTTSCAFLTQSNCVISYTVENYKVLRTGTSPNFIMWVCDTQKPQVTYFSSSTNLAIETSTSSVEPYTSRGQERCS